jgi:demethoxyubiquinone hydroxylase (CLK1/Coq7/Cat5 family)
MDAPPYICFTGKKSIKAFEHPQKAQVMHNLSEFQASALAELMPILCCGEESAVIAFDGLSQNPELPLSVQENLQQIAQDECHHDELLGNVRFSLPTPSLDAALIRALRKFFISIHTQDLGQHLTQIAALDSGVCAILSTFLNSGLFHKEPHLYEIFNKIHNDEGRHTAVALEMAKTYRKQRNLIEQAEQTRLGLRQLLSYRADAMETLGINWDSLDQRLQKLPRAFLS